MSILDNYVQNSLHNATKEVFTLCKSARRQTNIDSTNNVTFNSVNHKI